MRFWLVDVPAKIVGWIFTAYAVYIGVLVILCFGLTAVMVGAWVLGLPIPWL